MNVARYDHTATLMDDNTVLATSGSVYDSDSTGAFSSERFDPVTNRWSPTDDVNVPRASHTASLLVGGDVLIAGGLTTADVAVLYDASATNSAEIYDPNLGQWAPTGSMRDARYSHTSTRLTDGRVLVTGGDTDSADPTNSSSPDLSSAELYDPTTRVWVPEDDPMSVSRANHTATLLPNGKVLVVGGQDNDAKAQASAELYDPVSGEWSATGSLAAARSRHTETLLPDGRVLVTGGHGSPNAVSSAPPIATTELYDPITGKWTSSPPAPAASGAPEPLDGARYDHTATLVGEKVLVTGGVSPTGGVLATTELYDPATGEWSPAASLAHRYQHTATFLRNGRLLAAGGCCPGDRSSEYRLAADLSISIADSPDPVPPGGDLTYTLSVQNAGPDDAEGVTVRSELPPGAGFVSASPGCSREGVTGVVCRLDFLDSGALPLQRQITVRHSEATPALPYTATVQSATADPASGTDPVRANNVATATTVVGIQSSSSTTPGALVTTPGTGGLQVGPAPLILPGSEIRRARAFRSCLAGAARHTRSERVLAGRGPLPGRARARRHLRRHSVGMRRRCVARHGRTPGRVTGLRARALSRRQIELSFLAPGTNRFIPPPARAYLVKQATRPILDSRGFRRAQTLCNGACRFAVTAVGERIRLTITDLRPGARYNYAIAARDNVTGRLGPRSGAVGATTR